MIHWSGPKVRWPKHTIQKPLKAGRGRQAESLGNLAGICVQTAYTEPVLEDAAMEACFSLVHVKVLTAQLLVVGQGQGDMTHSLL